jgi:hypothetical protein
LVFERKMFLESSQIVLMTFFTSADKLKASYIRHSWTKFGQKYSHLNFSALPYKSRCRCIPIKLAHPNFSCFCHVFLSYKSDVWGFSFVLAFSRSFTVIFRHSTIQCFLLVRCDIIKRFPI